VGNSLPKSVETETERRGQGLPLLVQTTGHDLSHDLVMALDMAIHLKQRDGKRSLLPEQHMYWLLLYPHQQMVAVYLFIVYILEMIYYMKLCSQYSDDEMKINLIL
jgi:hypothetical protein